jgi:two-component system, chemotaxis family, chemotaxis protein CheY
MNKILIVDDAVTVRMYHKHLVESLGYEVEEAENGIEALEKMYDFAADACLVDVNMPKMDGYRFVEELRQIPDLQHTPVIMVSTEAEPDDQEKAFAAGANFYLVKPAKPDDIQQYTQLIAGVVTHG